MLEQQFKQKNEMFQQKCHHQTKAERKIKYRAIRLDEIKDFGLRCHAVVSDLNLKKENERQIRRKLGEEFDPEPLKSKLYREIIENEKAQKIEDELKQQERQKLLDKKHQYDKFIQQVFVPKVDRKKVVELKDRIDKLMHPVKVTKRSFTPGMSIKQVEEISRGDLNFFSRRNQRHSGAHIVSSLPSLAKASSVKLINNHGAQSSNVLLKQARAQLLKASSVESELQIKSPRAKKAVLNQSSPAALEHRKTKPVRNKDILAHLDRYEENGGTILTKPQPVDYLKQQRDKKALRQKEKENQLNSSGKQHDSTITDSQAKFIGSTSKPPRVNKVKTTLKKQVDVQMPSSNNMSTGP